MMYAKIAQSKTKKNKKTLNFDVQNLLFDQKAPFDDPPPPTASCRVLDAPSHSSLCLDEGACDDCPYPPLAVSASTRSPAPGWG
jgi:hypothetical protein